MTESDYLNYADAHKDKLIRLINNFHPVNRQPGRRRATVSNNDKGDFITAPNAEAACGVIRKVIKDDYKGNPSDDFCKALVEKNWGTIFKILNEAWFGVPESTSCWEIDGFKEAVTLLEDWPEGENTNVEW